jgi:cobalamin synthase
MQLFIDNTRLPLYLKCIAMLSFPVAGLLISGGFFAAAIGKDVNSTPGLMILLYIGIIIFVTGLIICGIGLIRNR